MAGTGLGQLSKAIHEDVDLRIEYANSTTTYYGWASPGTATSAAAWEIVKETLDASGRTIRMEHGGNSGERDQVWDNRAAIQYGP